MYFNLSRHKLKHGCLLLSVFSVTVVSSHSVQAETEQVLLEAQVHFIETEDASCVVNDSKLISLESLNPSEALEVWVDRWFMNVQTADHTKHVLSGNQLISPLGCANTVQGPQHWTIHSVKRAN